VRDFSAFPGAIFGLEVNRNTLVPDSRTHGRKDERYCIKTALEAVMAPILI